MITCYYLIYNYVVAFVFFLLKQVMYYKVYIDRMFQDPQIIFSLI